MADVKISALPVAGTLTGIEIVPVVDGGVTQRTTTSDIAGLAPPVDLSNYSSTNGISLTTSLDSTIVASGTITLESQSGLINIHTNSTSESINIQSPGDDSVITVECNGSFGVTNIRANGPSGILNLGATGNGGSVFVTGGDTNGTVVVSALQGDAQLILGIINEPDVDLAGRNVFIHPTGNFGVSCFPAGTITLDASPNGQINIASLLTDISGDTMSVAGTVVNITSTGSPGDTLNINAIGSGSNIHLAADGNTVIRALTGSISIFAGGTPNIEAGVGLDTFPTLGFYGTAPVSKPPVPVTLGDVIAALQSLGLVGT